MPTKTKYDTLLCHAGGADRRIYMELSPKQQAVNEIKRANQVLILGHQKPEGDQLGSMLALKIALEKINKKVDVVVSDKIDNLYNFLPDIKNIKNKYRHSNEKILRIDTKKVPIKGMKWQKEDDFLNIYLDAEKNLKFEFIEIENGPTKPDLIIIINTTDIEKIDQVYDKNTELFFEVPIINIDFHPGNEYFGSINLIDLTATSSAEILVSLFESLGIKIDSPDLATNLLSGIIYNTQSFRNQNTTPKSLTVAAQLLAAGANQQEIVSNFYKKKPVTLLKLWGEMLENINLDKTHRFAWTKIDSNNDDSVSREDIFGAADDLLTNTPEADVVLILYRGSEENNLVFGKLKGSKNKEVLSISKLFGGGGTTFDAYFEYKDNDLERAEKNILKLIADFWQNDDTKEKQNLWDVIEKEDINKKNTKTAPVEKPDLVNKGSLGEDEKKSDPNKNDAIEEALKSISIATKGQTKKGFTPIREIIDQKKQGLPERDQKDEGVPIDIFDEGEDE